MSFIAELWRFMRVRKKYWLLPIVLMMAAVRRPDRADAGHRRRAVHLHDVLSEPADAHPRHVRVLPRQRGRAASTTAGSSPPPRRSASPARSTTPASPGTPSTTAWPRPASALDERRPRRLLRQAVPQVRAAARDLPRLRAARASPRSAWRCRCGSRRSCSRSGCWSTKLKEQGGERDLEQRLLFAEHHQSHAASAFFPSPFEEAAVLTIDGVGEWATTQRRHRPRQPTSRCSRRSTSRTRSACSTRPSPTTPASRSTPASTRSWASRPTASRKYAQLILEHLIDLKEDGSFRLDQDYFDYCTGLTMTNAQVRRAVRRAAAQARGPRARSARWTSPPRSRR